MSAEMLRLRLASIDFAAEGINLFVFKDPSGKPLSPYEAGAHIDIKLEDGLSRSYSLVGPAGTTQSYTVAVKKEEKGRGGSLAMHENLRVGRIYEVSQPRNNFPLVEADAPVVFIAGGIGITPIHAMIGRREDQGRSWELHYSARDEASAAFADRFRDDPRASLCFYDPDNPAPAAAMMDIKNIVSRVPGDAHLYCCGPIPMIEAFLEATADRDPKTVHVEYFTSTVEGAQEGHFTLVLKQSGQSFEIEPGQSILEVLNDAGLDMPFSCQDGICGSCEVRVLEGTPDHRDMVLTKEEQAENNRMMICCSGAKSAKLVIDV